MQTQTHESAATSVPDPLKRNLEWYIANQQDLSSKYNGKILLIVDENLVDVFDTMKDAYLAALKSFRAGTFSLQPCSPTADSYTLMLYSPFFSKVA